MKRRLDRLERASHRQELPQRQQLKVVAPPDDLPDRDYSAWAAQVEAEARQAGHRHITLALGALRGDGVQE
jgi:hypothetical protein